MSALVDIGGGLRAALAYRGMTVKQLADATGIDAKNIYTQLNRNAIRMDTFLKWARALNMPPSELMGFAERAAQKTSDEP